MRRLRPICRAALDKLLADPAIHLGSYIWPSGRDPRRQPQGRYSGQSPSTRSATIPTWGSSAADHLFLPSARSVGLRPGRTEENAIVRRPRFAPRRHAIRADSRVVAGQGATAAGQSRCRHPALPRAGTRFEQIHVSWRGKALPPRGKAVLAPALPRAGTRFEQIHVSPRGKAVPRRGKAGQSRPG